MATNSAIVVAMFRVGIIGAGLIGAKRALAVAGCGASVSGVSDLNLSRAQALAQSFGAEAFENWESLISKPDIQVILVATSNDSLSPIATAALLNGKHVLIEKPGGRNSQELKSVSDAAHKSGSIVRLGYNHRFHPGLSKAKELLLMKEIGDLLYFRARYGHGGRIGYESEWRANPKISGGGELIDQGTHLIDLCRWMGGEFRLQFGLADTLFWKMPVEDNAFLCLRGVDSPRYAWLHASCTEWKNLFSFEIYGTKGKIEVSGLGGSYGPETLQISRINREMGIPDIEIENFSPKDDSWQLEMSDFFTAIQGKASSGATLEDGIRTLEIVEETYRSNQS